MAVVHIPTMLRSVTGGAAAVEVSGATVGELVDALEARYPGIRARLADGDDLRPNLAVAVNGEIGTLGLLEDTPPGAEVRFVPAISGGNAGI